MDALDFIKNHIQSGRLYWTYHVNMRLKDRHIPRREILSSLETYEIIEEYPEDKYLPSYLVYAKHGKKKFHILTAIDKLDDKIIIITCYEPDSNNWEADGKTRRRK